MSKDQWFPRWSAQQQRVLADPLLRQCGPAARFAYLVSVALAGRRHGRLHRHEIAMVSPFADPEVVAAVLVAVGLWVRDDQGVALPHWQRHRFHQEPIAEAEP